MNKFISEIIHQRIKRLFPWFQNLHVGMLSIPVVNDHHFSTCVWNLQYKIITRLPLKDISIVDDDVFVLYLLTHR